MSNLEKEKLSLDFARLSAVRKCGLNVVLAKIENIKARHEIEGGRDCIKRINGRMKTFESTLEKCARKAKEFEKTFDCCRDLPTIECINESIQDLAGVRIVTYYLDDIQTICNDLITDDDIDVKYIKDYVTNPKGSGYRSLHLIVNVTINGNKNIPLEERTIPVEIQIRTSLMDAWASIEHKLVYKTSHDNVSPETKKSLMEMSKKMHEIDEQLVQTRDFEEACVIKNTSCLSVN